MKKFKSLWISHAVTLACGLVMAGSACADEKNASGTGGATPTASAVIAKYLEAIGGKDAVLKHNSMGLKGKWEVTAMNQSGDLELLKAKPNKQLMRIKLGDQGEIVTGYDGTVGWMLTPFAGAMLLDGKLLEQTSEEADFYSILHQAANYKSMATVGPARMDDKDCVELKLVTKSGREVSEYYDAKTGLLVATKGMQESPQGPSQITMIFSDYKKMGDILQATRLRVKAGEMEQMVTISSIEFDKVPEKEFDLPAEVKALIKK